MGRKREGADNMITSVSLIHRRRGKKGGRERRKRGGETTAMMGEEPSAYIFTECFAPFCF